MARTLLNLLTVLLFYSLIACTNESENQKKTENPSTVLEEKNDSIPVVKTDSLPIQNNETAEEATITLKPDSAAFAKVLIFKNIVFKVIATGKGSLQELTIQPSGLTATNRAEKLETEPVVNAEVGDLNSDGFPELLIFTRSAGSGSYGKVISFSVNKGKSMSRVTFPETSQNPEPKKGYGGHDKFSIVNNTLTQEFPIYKESDVNSKPSGMKRVITYKLKDGEASRFFVVDQVKEVPGK